MNGFDLATPWALLALPLPALAWLWHSKSVQAVSGLRVPPSLRNRLAADPGLRQAPRRPFVLPALAWIFLVAALAGPRILAATPALPASGRDIMLALDLSGSMIAKDMVMDGVPMSRIDALKRVGSALIRRRAGDRVGIVIFAEDALAAAPLSFDVDGVARDLNALTIGLVGRSTAMGAGLGLAVKRLAQSKAASRVIILMSDGANNAGSQDPAGVAVLARALGMRIFTIGLGPNETTNPDDDPESVDFEALKRYAELGGGVAFRARSGDDLDAATRAIERLVAGPALAPPALVHRDLWTYPAALFMVCAGIAVAARRGWR